MQHGWDYCENRRDNRHYSVCTVWWLIIGSAWLFDEKKSKYICEMKKTKTTFPWQSQAHSVGTALTISSSVSRVTLKMSPCSVWARKKNMDLVLCVAEQTKIMPLSGSSRSFWGGAGRSKVKQISSKPQCQISACVCLATHSTTHSKKTTFHV